MIYGFQLGREFKLSIAEIITVFPKGNTVFVSEAILLLDTDEDVLSKATSLGGTIKIFESVSLNKLDSFKENILEMCFAKGSKFNYGVSVFGGMINLKTLLIDCKKFLKSEGVSSRFINKDFKNISSAQIIGEKLLTKGADISLIIDNEFDKYYFGKTIWVQDIDAYSKRDYGKQRDMNVGMLPPKLSQMMINLSGGNTIYDPFVGLGTILIESVHMGNKEVYGSDLSDIMVDTSRENIGELDAKFDIIKLNAKFIEESTILKNNNPDAIVTEGYLGEMMTKKNISIERIDKQIKSLQKIYEPFFAGLKKVGFKGTIVICFPFWDLRGRYVYAESIYDIIGNYCDTQVLLTSGLSIKDKPVSATKSGSLLYKRPDQLVGREIFKLKIRNN